MGVDLQTYRARIGAHARHATRSELTTKANSLNDVRRCTGVFIMAITLGLILGQCVNLSLAWSSTVFMGSAGRQCGNGFVVSAFNTCPVSLTPQLTNNQASGSAMCFPTGTSPQYCPDLSFLLILSGMVEENPGPDFENKDSEEIIRRLNEAWDRRQQDATRALEEQLKTMTSTMNRLEQKFDDLKAEMNEVKDKLRHQDQYIDYLDDSLAQTSLKANMLEERLEEQERRSRRDNVILYNVPEQEDETHKDSEVKFLEIVNEELPNSLNSSDVKRAHRIGRPAPNKTRPLIACLNKSEHKYDILGCRAKLRGRGIGVSSDRTKQQRQQLQEARASGQHGYSQGGQRHADPQRHEPARMQTRALSRSQADTGLS